MALSRPVKYRDQKQSLVDWESINADEWLNFGVWKNINSIPDKHKMQSSSLRWLEPRVQQFWNPYW